MRVNLGSNALGDEGTEFIATALKESSTSKLQKLLMFNNGIGQGATVLAAYAAISASLTKVSAAAPFLFCYACKRVLLPARLRPLQLSRRRGQGGHPRGRARQRGL